MPFTKSNKKVSRYNPTATHRDARVSGPASDLNLDDKPQTTLQESQSEHIISLLNDIKYPITLSGRETFRTSSGKRVTPHQWAVYDFILDIPCGKVTTYKDICIALGSGSPRSVGAALRNNPFAPYVPCHRVIASNHFIGGFCGEWGKESKTGTQCNRKLDILEREGVSFTKAGYITDITNLWKQ